MDTTFREHAVVPHSCTRAGGEGCTQPVRPSLGGSEACQLLEPRDKLPVWPIEPPLTAR
jgi:hypothetical protein